MPVPATLAVRLVEILEANLRRRHPYHLSLVMEDVTEIGPPHRLTPIFCGCFDWHSAVHSHWALVRLGRPIDLPGDDVAREHAFLARRPSFELPYGLGWLLTLAGELRLAGDTRLAPLEELARDRLVGWLGRLPVPVRGGEHTQTAFAAGLALDWARVAGDAAAAAAIGAAAERLHGGDRDAPLGYEPGAYDFLSPSLATAALIARVRPADDFAAWLDGFAPRLGRAATLAPVAAVDRDDGKLVHWDGLNLSRAWMLDAIAAALPAGDERRPALAGLAAAHGAAGVAALDDMTYAGSHWLPSFAVYWLTGPLRP
jgi:hypothetical protein